MHQLLTILFSFFTIASFSQTVTKVLVIDTIAGDVSNFIIRIYDKGGNSRTNSISPQIDTRVFPNLICELKAKSGNFSAILPLDDSCGGLELEDIFRLQNDTIKISKLNIFHNCLPDSTSYSLTWFKSYPSDTGNYLVELSSKKVLGVIHKNCKTIYPDSVDIIINGDRHKSKLVTTTQGPAIIGCEIAIGHGFAEKRGKRQEKRKLNNKSYKYFVFARSRCKLFLAATIALK